MTQHPGGRIVTKIQGEMKSPSLRTCSEAHLGEKFGCAVLMSPRRKLRKDQVGTEPMVRMAHKASLPLCKTFRKIHGPESLPYITMLNPITHLELQSKWKTSAGLFAHFIILWVCDLKRAVISDPKQNSYGRQRSSSWLTWKWWKKKLNSHQKSMSTTRDAHHKACLGHHVHQLQRLSVRQREGTSCGTFPGEHGPGKCSLKVADGFQTNPSSC